ncbi:MAG: hypothetical protein WC359_14275 [Dehalococcoidia bacterium]
MLYTGWTFEQVGGLTIPQMRAVLGAVNRRRKEQIEMMGGKVSEGDKEVDGTIAIEQRLQILRAKTGKTKFDLREVI